MKNKIKLQKFWKTKLVPFSVKKKEGTVLKIFENF